MNSYNSRHYYNNILFTPWPFFIGVSLFHIIYLSILMINKYFLFSFFFSMSFLFLFFYCMIEAINAWIFELIEESFYGKYTKKLRSALTFGFILFLLSEIMLFGSFFWVFFDRLFHLSYVTGFLSVPTMVETLRWFKEPLAATFMLISSGYCANKALFNYIDNRNLSIAYIYSIISNILGSLFLYVQYLEYNHLTFTFSQTVYCSIFFVLTGFHGIHVFLGNFLLFFQYWIKYNYKDNRTMSLTLTIFYWHFVDIIWFFLFFFVYAFNNLDYLALKSSIDYN